MIAHGGRRVRFGFCFGFGSGFAFGSWFAFGVACACLGRATSAAAGEADVMSVDATCNAIRTCDFQVAVRHADIGWSHYAVAFEIVAPGGEVLGTRELQHPHVHEQPFVRGLVGVEIPEGVDEVIVRARDSQHGLGGESVTKRLVFPPRAAPAAEAPVQKPDSD